MDPLDLLNDPQAYAKREELKAMARHRAGDDPLWGAPRRKSGTTRRGEPTRSGKLNCWRSPAFAVTCPPMPRPSFREALQYYWFVHLGVITELNPWDAFNPGHLDQHLLPFYRQVLPWRR